jgi:periplasmic divalent cation tolerance protein
VSNPDNLPQALIVFVTVPDADVGARSARVLVEERLAACVNILPAIRSIYVWKDAVTDEAEALCLIKTQADRFDQLQVRLGDLHPYDVPEILAVEPARSNPPYLRWLIEATTPPAER